MSIVTFCAITFLVLCIIGYFFGTRWLPLLLIGAIFIAGILLL